MKRSELAEAKTKNIMLLIMQFHGALAPEKYNLVYTKIKEQLDDLVELAAKPLSVEEALEECAKWRLTDEELERLMN